MKVILENPIIDPSFCAKVPRYERYRLAVGYFKRRGVSQVHHSDDHPEDFIEIARLAGIRFSGIYSDPADFYDVSGLDRVQKALRDGIGVLVAKRPDELVGGAEELTHFFDFVRSKSIEVIFTDRCFDHWSRIKAAVRLLKEGVRMDAPGVATLVELDRFLDEGRRLTLIDRIGREPT